MRLFDNTHRLLLHSGFTLTPTLHSIRVLEYVFLHGLPEQHQLQLNSQSMSAHAIELRAHSAQPCLQQALAHPRHYALGLGGPGLRPRAPDSGGFSNRFINT